jgi:hypothetical protein
MSATILNEIDEKIATYCHRDLMAARDVIDILLDLRQMVVAEDELMYLEPEPVPA